MWKMFKLRVRSDERSVSIYAIRVYNTKEIFRRTKGVIRALLAPLTRHREAVTDNSPAADDSRMFGITPQVMEVKAWLRSLPDQATIRVITGGDGEKGIFRSLYCVEKNQMYALGFDCDG